VLACAVAVVGRKVLGAGTVAYTDDAETTVVVGHDCAAVVVHAAVVCAHGAAEAAEGHGAGKVVHAVAAVDLDSVCRPSFESIAAPRLPSPLLIFKKSYSNLIYLPAWLYRICPIYNL